MSRRLALLALGLALATGSAVAQEGLPSVVASLPVEGWADELRSLAAAGSALDGFLLPPLPVGPGEMPSWEPAGEALKLVHELFPEVGQAWLRLTLTAPPPGMTEKDIEAWVARLADDVTGSLGPSLTGVILEPDKAVPDELLRLVVSSISIARNAGGNAVQIALPCGDAGSTRPVHRRSYRPIHGGDRRTLASVPPAPLRSQGPPADAVAGTEGRPALRGGDLSGNDGRGP